jgi:hypothetical protein
VDEVLWVAAADAMRILSHQHDVAVVDAALG